MQKYRGAGLVTAAAVSLALASGAHAASSAGTDPAEHGPSFLKFNVANLPAMQTFYEKAFGMHQQKRLDNPANIEVVLTSPTGADVALVYYKDGRKIALGNANGSIGFYLKDVDAAYARAMAAGAASRTAPRSAGGEDKVAIVADPEGHDIELLHLH